MSVKVKVLDDIVVIYAKGMFTGGKETDELEHALDTAYVEGFKKVVVNLKNATYMSTPGISALVKARKGFMEAGGRVVLSNVNDRINQVFVVTKLILVFETYETEAEAIESFEDWVAPEAEEVVTGAQ